MTSIKVQVSASGTNAFDVIKEQERYENLCKAAPEMYEALDNLVKIAEEGDVVSWADEWDSARAALAKARGETEQ